MPETPEQRMIHDVGAKQERMLRARRERRNWWGAIAIVGVIGWSVVVPTLAGVAVGAWLDRHYPQSFSWTVSLLIAGLAIGCATAWLRIKEDK
ncbi:MAG TPA: AtpZ/AtpI family protein [Bryobacteraceae bacterium]|jgi:ATP synthase protein I|nr:AtpZ/AtpI family protein [Bryobacteraceae bacterium]